MTRAALPSHEDLTDPKARAVYDEIRAELGFGMVPNLCKSRRRSICRTGARSPRPWARRGRSSCGTARTGDIRIGYLLALQLSAALRNAMRFEEQKRLMAAVEAGRLRSDRLLENILPARIAEEPKRTGRVVPVHYLAASVLLKNTAALSPDDLVSTLDDVFRSFDAIAGKHGLEKLKTIG